MQKECISRAPGSNVGFSRDFPFALDMTDHVCFSTESIPFFPAYCMSETAKSIWFRLGVEIQAHPDGFDVAQSLISLIIVNLFLLVNSDKVFG